MENEVVCSVSTEKKGSGKWGGVLIAGCCLIIVLSVLGALSVMSYSGKSDNAAVRFVQTILPLPAAMVDGRNNFARF